MPASDYFATQLIDSIRDRCLLPASDDTLNDARMLRLINDELRGYMASLLVTLREEYLVQHFDVGPIATGGRRFRMPPRAVASALRDVRIKRGTEELPTVRLELDSRPDEHGATAHLGYWLEGDDIEFTSALGAGDVIRFRCAYMPKLVDEAVAGAVVETIAPDRNSFTYANKPPGPWPPVPGPADFIRLGGSNQPVGLDTTVQTVTVGTRTVTLAAGQTVPIDVLVGDYVIGAGQTVIPPLPEALMPVLCQRVAYVALRAIGDQKAEAALAQLVEMRALAEGLMRPRTEAQPRYIINRYSAGWRR